uniref:Uncharacterized protein n=1 Tax=Rhizophora mucronata TaxID=61149 RepID=A0A2P2M5I6_RHIMU
MSMSKYKCLTLVCSQYSF